MTPSLSRHEPDGATDDAALDALLLAADQAVLDKLDEAVDLDEGRARIFLLSVTPDQEPVPYFLRPSTASPPPDRLPLRRTPSDPPAREEGTRPSRGNAGPAPDARSDISPRHDRARIDEASSTRQQPR